MKINKKKNDMYFYFARELRNLLNMKGDLIPFVTGELATVPKDFDRGLEELEIGGRAKTIQSTAFLR